MKKEIIFIFSLGLIPLLWFKKGFVAFGHDMSYPLAPVDFFLDRLFTWTDRIGTFGSNQTDAIPGIFIHGLDAFFSFLGLSLIHTQQLNFIFWFTLPGITMYILLRSLHPAKEDFLIRISGSLFYMLNHYLLQAWLIAERTKFGVVTAMPLMILIIINVVVRRKSIFKQSILLALTLFFLNGGAGIPLFGGLFIASLTALIVTFILSPYPFLDKFKRSISFILLSVLMLGLLNIYWVYPYIHSFSQNYTQRVAASGGAGAAVSWSQGISQNASFSNLFKLQGIPDWYDNPGHPYANNFLQNPPFIGLGILFPILAFLGLLKRRKETRDDTVIKITFLAILLVGIPFVAGSHPPTGILYDLALKNIPGFPIFRTPFYKFGMVIWFAYSYLIAIGLKIVIDWLKDNIAILKFKKITTPIFVFLFILLLFMYNYPFFTGSFFNWSKDYTTMVKVPDYIFEAKKELDNNKFSDRILFIPDLDNRTQHVSYTWKYFSLATIPNMLSRKPIVINDATLMESERGLINRVYKELRDKGESKLLKYIGASRVVITDDFSIPQDLNYQYEDIKDRVRNSKYFVLSKKIDQWEFFNSIEQPNPLIYPSNNNSFLFINSDNLGLIADIPGIGSLGDSFIIQDINVAREIDSSIANKYVLEGSCINCDDKKGAEFLNVSTPRILPGNKLYFLSEIANRYRKSRIKSVLELNEFLLKDMAKETKALEILLKDGRNTDTIRDIVQRMSEDLSEIEVNYLTINDQNQKKDIAQKIYLTVWYFVLKSNDWQELAADFRSKDKLILFENLLRNFIEKYSLSPIDQDLRKLKRYKLSVPISGDYKLSAYADPASNYLFLLNNVPVNLKKSGNWFQSEKLKFDKGEHFIDVPEAILGKISINPIVFKVGPGRSDCREFKIDVDPQNTYKINFNYQSNGKKINISSTEQNSKFTSDHQIYPSIIKISDNPERYKVEFSYKLGLFTTSATFKFCLDGDYLLSTKVQVDNIEITYNYSLPKIFLYSPGDAVAREAPNLEFVALNQTKYIIRVKGNSRYILNFNSRRDDKWILREIDPNKAGIYFTGDKKQYLGGRVTEYERKDKHIFTDYYFPYTFALNPNLSVNLIGNGWIMEGLVEDTKTYLLEYTLQDQLYKLAIISLVSLLLIIALYILLRKSK